MDKKNIAILLFDDVDLLDVAGPFEVFSVTAALNNGNLCSVFTVAQHNRSIRTWSGYSVNPAYTFADCPPPHLLLIPGGIGTRAEMKKPAVIAWIQETAAKAELVLSVCTGALLLAQAGLLDGLEATTHHQVMEELRGIAPSTRLHTDRRYVDNGRLITSAGIAAGIDMALYVVSRLFGEEQATKVAGYMEYDWPEPQREAASA